MAKSKSIITNLLCLFLLFTQAKGLRTLQTNTSGICYNGLSTYITTDQSIAHGMVFAVKTAASDTVGTNVVSMGFHVEPSLMNSGRYQYEVYALNNEGYYADPNRGESILADLSYDYRGQIGSWTLVANGDVSENELDVSVSTPLSTIKNYYSVPMESFTSTSVPPNGGQRSFYVTLQTAGIIMADPGDNQVNDVATLAGGEEDGNSPQILIGESAMSYPFTDTAYLYAPKVFMGTVYFEEKCPTESPSMSTAPSDAPSNVSSESPSEFPSLVPSTMPSVLPSSVPSIRPSVLPSASPSDTPSVQPTLKAEEVRSGLLLALDVPECVYGPDGNPIEMTSSEQDAVAETVKASVSTDAEESYVYNTQVEVSGIVTVCGRRLSSKVGFESSHHRILPSGAAAVEFSMIITGEYRPPVIPGIELEPMPRSLDLGSLAEESINRDPEQFVRELKDRAPPTSSLNQVETLNVEAVEAPPEGAEVVFTKKPTSQPTNPPFQNVIIEDQDNTTEKTILLSCIVATSGVIVILGAFLMLRFAGRRAIRKHEEEIERRKRKREFARRKRRREFNEEEVDWANDMSGPNAVGYHNIHSKRMLYVPNDNSVGI